MKTFKLFSGLFLFAFLSIYCEEGPATPDSDPGKAKERVSQANQILGQKIILLFGSGGADPAAFDVSSANALYKEAIELDPDNLDAQFGAGLTEVLLIGADSEVRTLFQKQGELSADRARKSVPPVFSEFKSIASLYTRQPSALEPLNALYTAFKKAADEPPFSFYQGLIETRILPKTDYAIDRLTRVVEDPNYAFYITSEMVGQFIDQPIELDLTEFYALLAFIQFMHANGSIAVAYNVDYNARDQNAVLQSWQIDSPFLALRTNGAERMRDTKAAFVGAMTSLQQGVNFLLNEKDNQDDDVIKVRPEDAQELLEFAQELDGVKSFFTTTQIIVDDFDNDGMPEELAINLGNFFDNPIANFKQKLPSYTAETALLPDGRYAAVVVWQANSYSEWIFPDPTFNNLFPGITDMQFKETFGLQQWTKRWEIRP